MKTRQNLETVCAAVTR